MTSSSVSYTHWVHATHLQIRHCLLDCISRSKQGGWREDHISTKMLDALETQGTDLTWTEHSQRTVWEAYKLSGIAEQNYGDIAVLVRVWLTKETYLDG